MSVLRRRDNGPEMAVRRLLHAAGLRYRVSWPVPGQRRRTIDIAFTRARLAVYIDGCFWHGCPIHATSPKANSKWWADKLAANRARDRKSTRLNSSHANISYAVFCLKKKQHTPGQPPDEGGLEQDPRDGPDGDRPLRAGEVGEDDVQSPG